MRDELHLQYWATTCNYTDRPLPVWYDEICYATMCYAALQVLCYPRVMHTHQRPGMKSDIGTQKKKVICFGQIDFFSRTKSFWPKKHDFFFWVPMSLFIPGR